jgi:glutamate-ammonia-ligase adenylyltransferase
LHKAWIWEHQALSRARFVAGDQHIGQQFEQIRTDVMIQHREPGQLKTEVSQMREKMRDAQNIPHDQFDLKHSLGGIIDVEFLVQYLVLSHAAKNNELTRNIGNIALLKLLASFGIIEAGMADNAAIAYREYRKMQHALKLQGVTHNKVEATSVQLHASAVITLWKSVFAA